MLAKGSILGGLLQTSSSSLNCDLVVCLPTNSISLVVYLFCLLNLFVCLPKSLHVDMGQNVSHLHKRDS